MGPLGKLRIFLSDNLFARAEFLRERGNYRLSDFQLVQRLRNAKWPEAYWRARQCAKYVSEHESRAEVNERLGDPRDFHYDALQGAGWTFIAIVAITAISALIINALTSLGIWACIGYGVLCAFGLLTLAMILALLHDEFKYFKVELCEHTLAISDKIWPDIRNMAYADYCANRRKAPESLKDKSFAEKTTII